MEADMDHFTGINAQERYNNELMTHARKQTELLEQIAQLLQQTTVQSEETKPNTRRKT